MRKTLNSGQKHSSYVKENNIIFGSEKFNEVTDDFFAHGLAKSDLDGELSTEEVMSWFDKIPDGIEQAYWIEPPFCFASIYEEEGDKVYGTYEATEQDSNIRDFMLESVGYDLSDMNIDYVKLFNACDSILNMVKGESLDVENYADLYYAKRHASGFMSLYPYTRDVLLEEVSSNASSSIFVYHSEYESIPSNLEDIDIDGLVTQLLDNFGYKDSSGLVDKHLTNNISIIATFGSDNTNLDGTTFTLKTDHPNPFSPIDLYESNTYSSEALSYLWLAIENNLNVLVGGSSSGKKLTIEALSHFTGHLSKVVSVENRERLSLPLENWIPGTPNGLRLEDEEDMDMRDIVESSFKQRPEYLLIDELRGQEAKPIFNGMNDGHTVLSTINAENTVSSIIGRLNNPPMNVPKDMIMSLDIICTQNTVNYTGEDGNSKSTRKAEDIRELVKLRDNGMFENRRPFKWDEDTDTFVESVKNSTVIDKISKMSRYNDMTKEEVIEEIKSRKELIELISESNIMVSESVRQIIIEYQKNPDLVMEKARQDELEELI
jgi:flagellar protein FlaI